MSNLRNFATVIFTTVLFVSCVNDSEPINEEEVITTLTVTLVPDGGGTEIVLSFQDLDGDGPDAPTCLIFRELWLLALPTMAALSCSMKPKCPAEDITEEVKEEDLDHQFFYTVGTGLDVTTAYSERRVLAG